MFQTQQEKKRDERAYLLGMEAKRKGLSIDVNPYRNKYRKAFWEKGWHDEQNERNNDEQAEGDNAKELPVSQKDND